jgi:hypothetical protein
MPRRKSLITQMYEARQKAKLQQQKLEEQANRAWAELARQDVIPAVTGYRYVKTKDVIQPDPRKEPEIKLTT